MRLPAFALFSATTLFVTFGVKAQTPEWKTEQQFITFDAPGLGTSAPGGTFPASINPNGDIAGWDMPTDQVTQGFLRKKDGSIITFEAPGAGTTGGSGTRAASINARGEITGFFGGASGTHGFVLVADGTVTAFDAPDAGEGTYPSSINTWGDVTGWYYETHGIIFAHGFLRYSDGSITTFEAPGSGPQGTYAIGINASDEIMGEYIDANNVYHGFLRDKDGSIIPFDVPGVAAEPHGGTFPRGMNQDGEITGSYNYTDTNGGTRGFIRHRDGTFTTFAVPGMPSSGSTSPLSINPKGEVTGWWTSSNAYHGFVREPDGTITTFDVPGSAACDTIGGTYPASINPSGEITGYFYDANCFTHGFLRKPDHHEGSRDKSGHEADEGSERSE
jgi:hypothetical protein